MIARVIKLLVTVSGYKIKLLETATIFPSNHFCDRKMVFQNIWIKEISSLKFSDSNPMRTSTKDPCSNRQKYTVVSKVITFLLK